jgi:hypothetical protein
VSSHHPHGEQGFDLSLVVIISHCFADSRGQATDITITAGAHPQPLTRNRFKRRRRVRESRKQDSYKELKQSGRERRISGPYFVATRRGFI